LVAITLCFVIGIASRKVFIGVLPKHQRLAEFGNGADSPAGR
jgi:hypothetical protein